jgi:hypothetical protein
MRNTGSIFFSFILALLGSCNSDTPVIPATHTTTARILPEKSPNTILGYWKILSATLNNKTEPSPGNYYLIFREIRSTYRGYELILDKRVDVNDCGGYFDLPSEAAVTMGVVWRTKVCCDSPYANKLVDVINEMSYNTTNYVIRNDSLFLTSTSTLTLYRVK